MSKNHLLTAALTAALALLTGCTDDSGDGLRMLNVSYDPTRDLWRELNRNFIARHEKESGTTLRIKASHGGSSSQARAVTDGLDADVVTLAMHSDTDGLRQKGLIGAGWENRLPNNSLPYFSTIVFVVRKGNPRGIKDWPDLVKPDVSVITPNPRTSGNGQLSLYAAWGAILTRGGSREEAVDYLTRLYQQVPVLDSGARGATTTFLHRGLGDVHLAWENEARFEIKEGRGRLELVYPPISIRAEPHVAVVDKNVDRKGTRAVAEAYLQFLYTDEGQEIIAKHYFRPSNAEIMNKHAASFPEMKLFSISEIARDWSDAYRQLIGDGGVFDTIYRPKGKR